MFKGNEFLNKQVPYESHIRDLNDVSTDPRGKSQQSSDSSNNRQAEVVTVIIKTASVAIGSAVGGYIGGHIGSVAGSSVPVVGKKVGKVTGEYIGSAVGGSIGNMAGDAIIEQVLPLLEDKPQPGYIRVDVHPDHTPPRFFEKLTAY